MPGSESMLIAGQNDEGGAGTETIPAHKHMGAASHVLGAPAPCPPIAMVTCEGGILVNSRLVKS